MSVLWLFLVSLSEGMTMAGPACVPAALRFGMRLEVLFQGWLMGEHKAQKVPRLTHSLGIQLL